jgi:hypothetical protein
VPYYCPPASASAYSVRKKPLVRQKRTKNKAV